MTVWSFTVCPVSRKLVFVQIVAGNQNNAAKDNKLLHKADSHIPPLYSIYYDEHLKTKVSSSSPETFFALYLTFFVTAPRRHTQMGAEGGKKMLVF